MLYFFGVAEWWRLFQFVTQISFGCYRRDLPLWHEMRCHQFPSRFHHAGSRSGPRAASQSLSQSRRAISAALVEWGGTESGGDPDRKTHRGPSQGTPVFVEGGEACSIVDRTCPRVQREGNFQCAKGWRRVQGSSLSREE